MMFLLSKINNASGLVISDKMNIVMGLMGDALHRFTITSKPTQTHVIRRGSISYLGGFKMQGEKRKSL